MEREELIGVALKADRLILESRLRDIAIIAQAGRSDRVRAIAGVISKLRPGAYLIGCGPYTCGVLPLTVEEVVLGRPPSPLESLPDSVADYTLNDAVWMLPREASRIHATIICRQENGAKTYWARDEGSRTGTYVNCRRVGVNEHGEITGETVELSSEDVVSLGPSGVNCYVFLVMP
ncbi:MAG: FHA domain-containing protein [Phycisphaeraceae bacterium]|nr:FHA domain-containing protein [Phycisphaeraceae bacterium]